MARNAVLERTQICGKFPRFFTAGRNGDPNSDKKHNNVSKVTRLITDSSSPEEPWIPRFTLLRRLQNSHAHTTNSSLLLRTHILQLLITSHLTPRYTMMVVNPMGEGGRGHGCGLTHHDRLRPHQHHFKHHRPHPLLVPPPHGSHIPPSCGPPRPFGRHHHPGHSHGRHLIPHHSCPHVMGGELIGLDNEDPIMAPHHHHHPGPPPFAGFLGPHLHRPGHHFRHHRHGRVNPDAHDVGAIGPMVADCSSSGSEEEDRLHPEPRNTDACPLQGPAITENFVDFGPPPPPPMHMMMMMHWGHAGRFLHSGELPLHLGVSENPHDLLAGLLRGANSSSDHDLEKALRIRLLRHGGRRMRRHGGRRCSSVPHDAPHGCHPRPDAAALMRGHSGERGNLATTSAPINNVEIPNPVTTDEGVEDTNDALALMALNDTTNTDVNPSH